MKLVRLDKCFLYFLASLGAVTLNYCRKVGKLSFFIARAVFCCFSFPIYWKELFSQFFRAVYLSLPVVGLTALFTGAVLALQIYTGGARFSAESVVPSIVALGITRELGPVISALIISGRVSASIAAEIASMRVTEQVDALITMSADPMRYLVAPRLLSMVIGFPLLVAIADSIALMGGYIVSVQRLGFNPSLYLSTTVNYLNFEDVFSGIVKGLVFGFIIAISGCYQGYNSGPGSQGVGRATTSAVAFSCMTVLLANYILTEIFFSG